MSSTPDATPSVIVDLPDGELARGTLVGEYKIEGKLGQGGMGVVYAAVHPIIGKRAAVKVIGDALAHHKDAVQRFVQEAQAVNHIAHPNIVDIFSFGNLPDGRPYFVMELLRGESLGHKLARQRLPIGEAVDILTQVCRALAATHRQGIIHRDLKPENVFIDDRGDKPTVKLLDFGIAKLVRAEGGGVKITQDGTAMGTPSYASPELARAKVVDARSDVYSLGVMAFEMFVGKLPFEADNALDLLLMHVSRPPPEAASIWPEIPTRLNQLLLRMMAKEASARPSLDEVREILTHAAAPAAPTAPPTERDLTTKPVRLAQETYVGSASSEPLEIVRRRRMAPVVAVLGAIGLAITFYAMTHRDPVPEAAKAAPTTPPVAAPPAQAVPPAPAAAPAVAEAPTPPPPVAPARAAASEQRTPQKARPKAARPGPAAAPASPSPSRPAQVDDDGAMNPYAK